MLRASATIDGRRHHRLHPIEEGAHGADGAESADETRRDAADEEGRRQFVKAPAEPHHAIEVHRQRQQDARDDREVSTRQALAVIGDGFDGLWIRRACRMVHATQIANPATSMTNRIPPPASGGSSASLSAMPAWNGFVGPNADPTIAAPALIATTVIASTPMPRPSRISTGMSGMISSCMFSSAPPIVKNRATMRDRQESTTAEAPDDGADEHAQGAETIDDDPRGTAMRMVITTSMPAANPRGTAITARNGPTGAASTRWYVPATATLRPVTGSSRRSYSPAGRTQVSAAAMPMAPRRRMIG